MDSYTSGCDFLMISAQTKQQTGIFALSFILLILVSASVFAGAPGGASIVFSQDKGSFPLPAPSGFNVTAGNITQLNLSSAQQTFRWVGLYGNVSGTIKLGNSQSQVLFNWAATGKYVYASTSNAINWLNITPTNTSQVIANYPFLGNGTDNYSVTFNTFGTINSEILGAIPAVPEALTYNSTVGPVWETMALADDLNNTIFTGVVNATGGNSFSNETVGYQMIIPEDGLYQNTNPTQYYLWVELV